MSSEPDTTMFSRHDRGGVFLQASAAERVLGRPPAALLGTSLRACVEPDDAARLDEALTHAAEVEDRWWCAAACRCRTARRAGSRSRATACVTPAARPESSSAHGDKGVWVSTDGGMRFAKAGPMGDPHTPSIALNSTSTRIYAAGTGGAFTATIPEGL